MSTQKLPDTISWSAPEYQVHHRTKSWYIKFGLVALALILFAIYDRSIITIITFALLIVVIAIVSMDPPRKVEYKITKTGITIKDKVYPYKTIKSFWILYNPGEIKTLNFETTALLNTTIRMQLGSQDPVIVKQVLSKYIPEDLDREETMSETLARRLKI